MIAPTIGRDNRQGTGSSDSSKLSINHRAKQAPSPKDRKALNRKTRESFEHRADNLEISINGEARTSQRSLPKSVKLKRSEEPSFIEVFSEQGARLLFLHVTEPTLCPGLEQCEHIALSDGCSLGPHPVICPRSDNGSRRVSRFCVRSGFDS